MLPNRIPNYQLGVDPTIPRQVLDSKLKVIDKRRAEIEAALGRGTDDYAAQELKAERQALGDMRAETEAALNPKPKPARSPELEKAYAQQREADILFVGSTIKQRRAQILWNAEREAAAGNHRQARMLRLTIPTIPEEVCKEYGKPLALLAELDQEPNQKAGKRPPIARRRVPTT